MPFGLKNAAQAFQRMMDDVLAGLPFAFVYIDDVLVASENEQQHEQDLREVFGLLSANGIAINRRKCKLGRAQVRYLGHTVSADGVRPLEERVAAIRTRPLSKTKVEVARDVAG